MDAKITKSRLANFLSYDWLKIMVCIGVVVAALCVFFTTVATRPRDDQVFELYAYNGLSGGARSTEFAEDILKDGALSYDILSATFESFDAFETYGQAAYTARRAALQGKAVFVNGCDYTEGEGEEAVTKNRLDDFIRDSLTNLGEPGEYCNPYFEIPAFLADCKAYLESVFGEDLASGVPDEARVREIFFARNGKDKRFRTAAQKEEGVGLERERLIALKGDYLAVTEALESGVFSVYEFVSPAEKTYRVALNVGKIKRLTDFVFYTEADENDRLVRRSDNIYFVIYNNGKVSTDLKYHALSVLHWLLEEFNA